MAPASLCATCASVQIVRGRLGQVYLLCRNDAIPAKYPPQPVVRCSAHTAAADAPAPPQDVAPGKVTRDAP